MYDGLPLIGAALALRRDQLGTFERARRARGDVVLLSAGPPGWRVEAHGVFSPDGAQHVLVDAADRYRKETPTYFELAATIGDGLLTSQDETWRRQRRVVAPLFTRRRISEYAAVMADEAGALVARWRRPAAGGEPVDAHAEMTRFTLRVVGRVLFGSDVDAAVPVIRSAVPVVGDHILRRGLSPRPLPAGLPTPANRRATRAVHAVRGVVDGLIAARRADDDARTDLLGRLLAARDPETGEALDDAEVRSQVLLFLLAGHETTATALACTLGLVGSHPEVQDRIRAELDAVLGGCPASAADVAALPYLTAVFKEGLRLYPPAPVIGRFSAVDDELAGFRIPARSVVVVSPWVTHRHPEHWPAPERFDPDRFAPEASAGRHRAAWLPFGLGVRACIGSGFAQTEGVLALAAVLQAYTVAVPPGSLAVTTAITLRPSRPIRCLLRARG